MKYIVFSLLASATLCLTSIEDHVTRELGEPHRKMSQVVPLVATGPAGLYAIPCYTSWPLPATVSAALVDLPPEAFVITTP